MSTTGSPLLDHLDEFTDGLSWQEVLSVRRSLSDFLGHKADQLQAADTTPAHALTGSESNA